MTEWRGRGGGLRRRSGAAMPNVREFFMVAAADRADPDRLTPPVVIKD